MRTVIFLLSLSISFNVFALSKFTVLSYNVENLFDTKKDEGKNDWTFLPSNFKGKKEECNKIGYWRYKEACHKINWTESALKLKIKQIKKYVESIQPKPQFIGLSEIENEQVVKMLATELGYSGYQVSNSPDKRGIDVALLYNETEGLKFTKKREITLKDKYFKKKPTRNILEVEFNLVKKDKLTIFVNHWPSLGNPTSTRIVAAKALKKRMLKLNKTKGHYLIALGDFNTIPENNPRPFEDVLLHNSAIFDIGELFMNDKKIDRSLKKAMPLGTYFYAPKMTWNMLDRIFVNRRLNDGKGLDLVRSSYRIHAPRFSRSEHRYEKGHMKGSIVTGIPFSYDHSEKSARKVGFSDHFGIVASFIYR